MSLTKKRAERLVELLRADILNFDKHLSAFLDGEGWKARGFDDPLTWWDSDMSTVPLSGSFRKVVLVKAALASGLTDEQIALKSRGRIGEGVARLIRGRDALGMRPEHISTRSKPIQVRSHGRERADRRGFDPDLSSLASADERNRWKDLAEELALDPRKAVLEAVRAWALKAERQVRANRRARAKAAAQ